MSKVGDLLGIDYLGTHTMRKTVAYRVYTQSNYNIGLVINLLNNSSEAMTNDPKFWGEMADRTCQKNRNIFKKMPHGNYLALTIANEFVQ